MTRRLARYACELIGTAIMMAIGAGAVVLFWAPGSPVPRIEPERFRLFVTGFCFAGGATLVVYSRLGRMSGAHLNPAVTFGFWRLRRIETGDALAYAAAQTLGAITGVAVIAALTGQLGRAVELAATRPGDGVTMAAAFGYEAAITFAL